jgi:virulence-associated protein VapD
MITDELMAQENWRNKADQPIKIKKKIINSKRLSKYTSPCSDIRRILNTSGLRSTSLSVILNENLLPSVKVNKEKILILNTCAFDSLLVAITVSYIDSKSHVIY